VLDADGQPDSGPLAGLERPLELRLADGRLSSNGACNSIGGGYRIEDGRLHVDALAQTLRGCPQELLNADAALVERLEGTPRFALAADTPPTLTLTADDGRTLVFEGEATPETRFGSAGTRMFLEVAAKRESCSHPLIADMQCLMVREVRYDDAGVQTRVSEDWQPLYQEIEGYEHSDGVRNVLRLKRFDIANPPADAPSVAYVLDMVVESETVSGNN
jgi:heat shock protein HslJ